jgi:hypothetical protein
MKELSGDEIDQDTLDEGCFYLSKLGLRAPQIAKRFELTTGEVGKRRARFTAKLKAGDAVESESDKRFWSDVMREAEGNVKVTFVTEKGFHHAWRTDLQKLDEQTLFSIYESCKHFLNLDPNARFLEYAPPKNYDPLAMQREIRNAVVVIGALLEDAGKPKKRQPGEKPAEGMT